MGKSHLACALGHALVEAGGAALYSPRPTRWCSSCWQRPAATSCLPRTLRALDQCSTRVILDDLGYVQQTAEEAEVLFTLMAERYERRSLIQSPATWSSTSGTGYLEDRPMATAAAIDRLVHHAVILEFNVPSYRTRKRRRPDSSENTESAVAEPA